LYPLTTNAGLASIVSITSSVPSDIRNREEKK
jgi:hypothetical protein